MIRGKRERGEEGSSIGGRSKLYTQSAGCVLINKVF